LTKWANIDNKLLLQRSHTEGGWGMEEYIVIGIRTQQDASGQKKREPFREIIKAISFALALKKFYSEHQMDDSSLVAVIRREEVSEVQRLL